MEAQLHLFNYCHAEEIPRYVYIPEHDDFDAGLGLNKEALGAVGVDGHLDSASVTVDTHTDIIPKTPDNSAEVSVAQYQSPNTPLYTQFPLFDNVLYKVEYLGKFY